MSEPGQASESQLFGGGTTPSKPKAPGLGEQLLGVFTDPVALFKKLHDAPSWGWAIGAIVVVSLILTVVWGLKVDVDAMLRPAMEKNPQLSSAQIDQAIEMSGKFMLPFGIIGSLVMPFIGVAFMALLYWLVGMKTAEDQKPGYLQSLSAVSVSSLLAVPYSLLIALMCLLRKVGGLKPEQLSPTSIGYYIQPENPKLYALLSQLDLLLLGGYVLVYLAARHTLRLKASGAAACTVIAVLVSAGLKIVFAK